MAAPQRLRPPTAQHARKHCTCLRSGRARRQWACTALVGTRSRQRACEGRCGEHGGHRRAAVERLPAVGHGAHGFISDIFDAVVVLQARGAGRAQGRALTNAAAASAEATVACCRLRGCRCVSHPASQNIRRLRAAGGGREGACSAPTANRINWGVRSGSRPPGGEMEGHTQSGCPSLQTQLYPEGTSAAAGADQAQPHGCARVAGEPVCAWAAPGGTGASHCVARHSRMPLSSARPAAAHLGTWAVRPGARRPQGLSRRQWRRERRRHACSGRRRSGWNSSESLCIPYACQVPTKAH